MKVILILSYFFISSFSVKSQGDNLRLHYQNKHPQHEIYNDIWGWEDTLNNKQYAIIGSSDGFLIYDVTYLNNISLIIDNTYFHDNNLDFKTYDNYLFTSGGNVYDLHELPSEPLKIYEFGGFSHNIFITDNYLFDDKLNIYNLTDPLNPVMDQLAVGGGHDILVHDSLLITFGGWGSIAEIYNLNDSISPFITSVEKDTNIIMYSHSGIIYEKENLLYISDENSTKVAVFDISNPQSPQFLNHFEYDSCSTPHNFWIKSDTLFMSHYSGGVVIFNLSNNPFNPDLIGYFDTYLGCEEGIVGAFGIFVFENENKILVSDRNNGLFVFTFDESSHYDEPFMSLDEKIIKGEILKIYPNPFTNSFTISLNSSLIDEYAVSVYDLYGRIIYSSQQFKNETIINLDNHANGVYIVEIKTQNYIYSERIIKN